jgi:hypothetical protein
MCHSLGAHVRRKTLQPALQVLQVHPPPRRQVVGSSGWSSANLHTCTHLVAVPQLCSDLSFRLAAVLVPGHGGLGAQGPSSPSGAADSAQSPRHDTRSETQVLTYVLTYESGSRSQDHTTRHTTVARGTTSDETWGGPPRRSSRRQSAAHTQRRKTPHEKPARKACAVRHSRPRTPVVWRAPATARAACGTRELMP